jgi:hypothetical protein
MPAKTQEDPSRLKRLKKNTFSLLIASSLEEGLLDKASTQAKDTLHSV